MIPLLQKSTPGSKCTVLCLGAHSDDIEIGCGGTLLHLLNTYPDAEVVWVVFSANRVRKKEALMSASRFLAGAAKKTIIVKTFRESVFPYCGQSIKRYFEQLKQKVSPDLVFTHYRDDLHQDHRVINQLTWNTFRRQCILEYEIPKYDGDMGIPNFFVSLPDLLAKRKAAYIIQGFPSQHGKQWFSSDTFLALLRLRGIEANGSGRYAEAFYSRKWVVG
ncbi:MAG: PIG-L deacetylase family protein [Nitrospira sp.]